MKLSELKQSIAADDFTKALDFKGELFQLIDSKNFDDTKLLYAVLQTHTNVDVNQIVDGYSLIERALHVWVNFDLKAFMIMNHPRFKPPPELYIHAIRRCSNDETCMYILYHSPIVGNSAEVENEINSLLPPTIWNWMTPEEIQTRYHNREQNKRILREHVSNPHQARKRYRKHLQLDATESARLFCLVIMINNGFFSQ